MKTFSFLTCLFLFFYFNTTAQVGINTPWTWVKGENTYYVFQPMPVQGVPSPTARPDPRQRASTFTDNDGKLWLFGGTSDIASPSYIIYNDLWKFDPVTQNWTWMKGDGGFVPPISIAPVYGTMGVPDIANKPGFRESAATWSDNEGNLWMFGGWGYGASGSFGVLNDLWKYNISSNAWTWMKGSSLANTPGNYGTAGVAAPGNNPPPRYGAVAWRFTDGTLWLSSGIDYYVGNLYNDIWKYDPVTNNWTWMKGTSNSSGTYGTIGVPATANMPPARYYPSGWTGSDGSLWMFGGHSSLNFPEWKNDVWRYEPATNLWTWEKGSVDIGSIGIYGTQGVEAPNNTPSSKFASAAVKDLSGNFWLFGGFDAVHLISNELWKFNPVNRRWTFVKGYGNTQGNYGTMGVPAVTNTPGSRAYTAMWTDLNGKFWLFGGYGNDVNANQGELTDLWMINSLSLLPDRRILLQGRTESEKNILNWRVNDVSDIQKFIIERSTDNVVFQPMKVVDRMLSGLDYQNEDRPNNNQRNYYRIKILYTNSHAYSNTISLKNEIQSFKLYPNPVASTLYIKSNANARPSSFTMYNSAGAELMKKNTVYNNDLIRLDVSSLPSGSYRLKLIFENKEEWASFIK